jgi:hypothetical protein
MTEARQAGKRRRSAPPISAHPLFPLSAALWFAAALGLGSLAIRPGLLEEIVLALGIDRLIPAAAPPLGLTARILLALGLGTLGAMLGMLLARRLNRTAGNDAAEARSPGCDGHADAPVRRPLHIREELDDEDFGEAQDWADAPSLPLRPAAQPVFEPFPAPVTALEDRVALPGEAPQAPWAAGEPEPVDPAPLLPRGRFDRPGDLPDLPPQAKRPFSRPADNDEPLAEIVISPPGEEEAEAAAQELARTPERPERSGLPGETASARLLSARLDSLSHVELIERLAISLQNRRERSGEAAAEASGYSSLLDIRLAPAQTRADMVRIEDREAVEPRSAPAGSDDSAVVQRRFDAPGGLALPDEPIEPGLQQPSAETTERALRAALASLQRISGAA